jgi:predicted glycoside hydrolase/deacetylase ChbG (UPF0249 family)
MSNGDSPRLIINADDLGLSHAVNDAIFDLLSDGTISSASVLANGPAVEDASRRMRLFPKASFGAHLNLTEFAPLAETPFLRPVLDKSGCFRGDFRRVRVTPNLRRGVLIEWSAQLDRLRCLGVPVSHVDSHHHVHTMPGLMIVLKRLLADFSIGKVRLTKNLYPTRARPKRSLLLSKTAWNLLLRAWTRARTTQAFTGLDDFVLVSPDRTRRLPSVELMVHPGNPAFASETALLRNRWRDQLPFATSLITYHEL